MKTGERADMGNTVAHLAGADDPDLVNGMSHAAPGLGAFLGPFLDLNHTSLPYSSGQLLTLSSSLASSGSA